MTATDASASTPGWEGGISGWRSDWHPAGDRLARHHEALRSLCGHRVTEAWLIWNLELDAWFADLPVVLRFEDGRQLEVCRQKFDDISITWNTIDLDILLRDWGSWPLAWRQAAHEALLPILGNTVTSVGVSEHDFTTEHVVPVPEPGTSTPRSTWLVGGLWLQTSTAGLHIFNALDENGLSQDTPAEGPGLRLTWLRP